VSFREDLAFANDAV